jgi:hypothetical protein
MLRRREFEDISILRDNIPPAILNARGNPLHRDHFDIDDSMFDYICNKDDAIAMDELLKYVSMDWIIYLLHKVIGHNSVNVMARLIQYPEIVEYLQSPQSHNRLLKVMITHDAIELFDLLNDQGIEFQLDESLTVYTASHHSFKFLRRYLLHGVSNETINELREKIDERIKHLIDIRIAKGHTSEQDNRELNERVLPPYLKFKDIVDHAPEWIRAWQIFDQTVDEIFDLFNSLHSVDFPFVEYKHVEMLDEIMDTTNIFNLDAMYEDIQRGRAYRTKLVKELTLWQMTRR